MSAEAYQRLMRQKKELAFDHIDRRSREFRRTIRVLTLGRMIDEVNLMRYEMEHITRSSHL